MLLFMLVIPVNYCVEGLEHYAEPYSFLLPLLADSQMIQKSWEQM